MTVDVHVVSHTHWDREWYLTREQFRLRLVDLIDGVLDLLDRDAAFAHYHLDGQTIVLEDYLEMRPEQADRVRRAVAGGRLLVGPWYVMPDEFLVSGEALVRNLAIGHRIAESFGGSMPVGYLPDLFGHVAQMPQILRQFGLDNAILWRGFGGRRAEYWWEAPDGSSVLLMHLPPEGYCNATRVAFNADEMVARAMKAVDDERERSVTGQLLLMNGVDHVEPHPAIPRLVERLSRDNGVRARHSTLPAYVDGVRHCVVQPDAAPLETIAGELRGGEDYANLLPGVLSARVYLKQANARVQLALEREAEPLSTCAWLAGHAYPAGELRYAWRTLIQNQPHDSICGCSIDAVHEENMSRFARAEQVAEALADRAAVRLSDRVPPPPDGFARLVVFNTDAHARSGVIEATFDLPYASAEPHRRVDPEAVDRPVRFWPRDAAIAGVRDADGAATAFQILDESDVIATVMSRYETPWQLHARRVRLLMWAKEIPPCGYTAFDVQVGRDSAASRTERVAATDRALENEHLRVAVNDDGTLDVEEKATGWIVRRALALEDVGDVGDEYNYSPPGDDCRVTTSGRASISRAHSGPLRASLHVEYELQVPAGASDDRRSRSRETVPMPVSLDVSLDAGARHVDVQVAVDNRARDHRLRLLVPSGAPRVRSARSDTAFGCIERPAERTPPPGTLMELPVSAAPFQTFIDAGDERGGVTVMSSGLAEYEIVSEPPGTPRNTIALTLVRAVGDLSRDDLVTRPSGHAGPSVRTPGAQCLGVHRFRVGIAPRSSASAAAALFKASRAFVLPPRAHAGGSAAGSGSISASLVTVTSEPAAVVLSALTKAHDRDAVILRLFNPETSAARVEVRLACGITSAFIVDLLERRQGGIEVSRDAVAFDMAPSQIRTIEVIPA
jgi:alpha-mannosidase